MPQAANTESPATGSAGAAPQPLNLMAAHRTPPARSTGAGAGESGRQQELGRFAGRIKSMNPQSYGFIACPALRAQGYLDVFVHHTQFRQFAVGNPVRFTAHLGSKGQ